MNDKANIFERLGFTPEDIYGSARATYDELIDFVTSPKFTAIHNEIDCLPENERPAFIQNVLCDPDELHKRGIEPPKGILIQRSTFGDRRPTLFCVKKYLPERFHSVIENVNLTFDNPHHQLVPEDAQAWREPLPVEVQAAAMQAGVNLSDIPDDVVVSKVDSNPYKRFDLLRGTEKVS